jgi:hydrogenase maturation protease
MNTQEKDIRSILARYTPFEIAVIGIGNLDRGDDGAGVAVADAFKDRAPYVFSESERSAESFVMGLKDIEKIKTVLFIDAVHFNGKPGEVKLFNSHSIKKIMPVLSTHQVSLSPLMGILIQHKKEVYLLGIQPETTALMSKMSHSVEKAIRHIEMLISEFLSGDEK